MTEHKATIGGWSSAVGMGALALFQWLEAREKAAESSGLVELVGVLVKSCNP